MLPFESDYFGLPEGTFAAHVIEVAEQFVNDLYKAPEQIAQAQDFLDRYEASTNG